MALGGQFRVWPVEIGDGPRLVKLPPLLAPSKISYSKISKCNKGIHISSYPVSSYKVFSSCTLIQLRVLSLILKPRKAFNFPNLNICRANSGQNVKWICQSQQNCGTQVKTLGKCFT